MAFRKRPYLVQPGDPIQLISLDDPSVDKAATEAANKGACMRFSVSTGMDRSELVIVGEPSVYHCLPLSPSQWQAVKTAGHSTSTMSQHRYVCGIAAFLRGCRAIDGFEDDSGSKGALKRAEWDEYVDPDVMSEVGNYIIKLSRNTEPDTPK